MSTQYVYRIIVESWPTPDGEPWERYYGTGRWRHDEVEGVPEWLQPLIEWVQGIPPWSREDVELNEWLAKAPDERSRRLGRSQAAHVFERLRFVQGLDGKQHLRGVVMPKPHRKNFLSASGGHQLVNAMNAFGAVARIERSKKVAWETDLVDEVDTPLLVPAY